MSGGARSTLELVLLNRLERAGLPRPMVGYRFHPARKWEFDLAWIGHSLAVEVEGATWNGGRHVRGSGYAKDCEKYNTAQLLGWRVLRFTRQMIEDETATAQIRLALGET